MSIRPNDPLLLAGRIMALFVQAIMAIAAVALLIAIPAVLIYRDKVSEIFAQEANDPGATLPIWALIGIMLIGLVLVSLLFLFFDRLRRIIATVGDGDPFQPENAKRLSQMGWLMLSAQLLVIPAIPFLVAIASAAGETEGGRLDTDGIDFGIVLLTIVLFILARVFRHGAQMREELEGTI